MSGRTYQGIERKKIPWYPTIDSSLCSSCGACLNFCSNEVYEQNGEGVVVANPYNCVVGCSACKSECPTGALTFPDQKELIRVLSELRRQP